jgi:hypothetical protein
VVCTSIAMVAAPVRARIRGTVVPAPLSGPRRGDDDRGRIDLSGEQQTETKLALEFFSGRLKAAP